MKPNGPAV